MENRNTRRTGIERLQDYRENRNTEKTGIQGEQECTEKKNTREQKYTWRTGVSWIWELFPNP